MDYLNEITNQTVFYWMNRIQTLIKENTSEVTTEDKIENGQIVAIAGHGSTDTQKMLHALIDDIIQYMPVSGIATGIPAYDENMRTMALLSLITTLWYSSVQRAKCFDPNRPVFHRQQAWLRYQKYATQLMEIINDIQNLPTYFPDQKWSHPFTTTDKNGAFI